MDEKILAVDDEKNILNAIQRQMRKQFHVETAPGPEQGLAAVKQRGPYAVVISDLRMPKMDGIQFLARVRELAPDTVRVMLTGNADLNTAIQAVNEGNIFRFLTKPCAPEILAKVIQTGIEQYRLITAERELLQKTLKGSINVLTKVLSLVNPEAFGRSSRIKRYVKQVADKLELPDIWRLELAAMLSQIGCVIFPEGSLKKLCRGKNLTGEETQLFDMHPMIASDLLSDIPRMQKIAEIIRYQEKHFDGTGNPKDTRQGKEIPLGARILKVALDFDLMEAKGVFKRRAIRQLKSRSGWYDPFVLDVFEEIVDDETLYIEREVMFDELKTDMILNEDIRTSKGRLLITRGQEVSDILLNRLKNFARTAGIQEPIKVLIPSEASDDILI
ncbi:MAG: response regulator [Deltaproteobacteria bacterium]|nr:response regulator [Deltaproteobacteria bacterium]MBW2014131.1 response regulator [Deltaproteobacteria bacterium]MBW2089551.1 response regulator [Deltaproteobacteria bacterium]MBW2320411.1 response regulator [Deltaproteobacteria bacterium]